MFDPNQFWNDRRFRSTTEMAMSSRPEMDQLPEYYTFDHANFMMRRRNNAYRNSFYTTRVNGVFVWKKDRRGPDL